MATKYLRQDGEVFYPQTSSEVIPAGFGAQTTKDYVDSLPEKVTSSEWYTGAVTTPKVTDGAVKKDQIVFNTSVYDVLWTGASTGNITLAHPVTDYDRIIFVITQDNATTTRQHIEVVNLKQDFQTSLWFIGGGSNAAWGETNMITCSGTTVTRSAKYCEVGFKNPVARYANRRTQITRVLGYKGLHL